MPRSATSQRGVTVSGFEGIGLTVSWLAARPGAISGSECVSRSAKKMTTTASATSARAVQLRVPMMFSYRKVQGLNSRVMRWFLIAAAEVVQEHRRIQRSWKMRQNVLFSRIQEQQLLRIERQSP